MLSYNEILKSFKIYALVVLTFITQQGFSQNLVPNGDFESYKKCPITFALPNDLIENYVSSWFAPTAGSSDYFNQCAPVSVFGTASVNVPSTFIGHQNARSGQGFCGMTTSRSLAANFEQREYISVKLVTPLVAGECYDFEMYINLANESDYVLSDFGAYFSAGKVADPTPQPFLPLSTITPQIINTSGFLTDTLGWTLISGVYMAIGGEDHVTIGNFKDDFNTNQKFHIRRNNIRFPKSYYFVDDVCLQKCLPSEIFGNDTTLCEGETLALDATSSGVTYLWQDSSTNATFNAVEAGTYWVQITGSCSGKIVSDTIAISFDTLAIDLVSDTGLCEGETLTLDATTPGVTYLWQDNSTNATFSVIEAGIYWVEITSSCAKKTVSDTVTVGSDTLPVIDLVNDTILCEGEILALDATSSGVTYLWQDSSTNATFNAVEAGIYWVEVTNNCGVESDTVTIDIRDCSSSLFVPNIFSPNGDGNNDVLFVRGAGIKNIEFLIFNRWGERVFKTENIDVGWDGNFRGKLMNSGVFMYRLKATFSNGLNTEKSGDVTLVR